MQKPSLQLETDLQAPLTPCQIATLQAWLDEPLVTQLARADDTVPDAAVQLRRVSRERT